MTDAITTTDAITLDTGVALLQTLLDEEIRQYERIIHVLNQKRDLLVAGNPQPLNALDQELLALSRKAMQLNQQRLSLMARMGYAQRPLSDLIAALPLEHVPALNRRGERLRGLVQDMRRINQDTGELLALSIHWIRETVDLIASAMAPEGSSYTAHGHKPNATKPGAAMAPVQSTIIRNA